MFMSIDQTSLVLRRMACLCIGYALLNLFSAAFATVVSYGWDIHLAEHSDGVRFEGVDDGEPGQVLWRSDLNVAGDVAPVIYLSAAPFDGLNGSRLVFERAEE